MSLPEEIMIEVMKMTDAQQYEVLDFARVLRQKEQHETTEMMEAIVAENEEAFR